MSIQVFIGVNMKSIKSRIEFYDRLFQKGLPWKISGSELLNLSRKLKKIEKEYFAKHNELIPKKIAIIGSYTTNLLTDALRLYLYNFGIAPEFYEGEYDSIASEILDTKSNLYSFKPDILILFTQHRDIKSYPSLFCTDQELEDSTNYYINYYKSIWEHLENITGCQVYQTNFVIPVDGPLGNLELNFKFSKTNFLKNLNNILAYQSPSHINIIDMDQLSSIFGKLQWFDDVNYFLSKQGFSLDAYGMVSHYISRLIINEAGKIRKCLVLDLDNTLWGGVIGDDGLEGIILETHNPLGEAYLSFQHYIKSLKERGVILAVCSKNETEIAKDVFIKHPEMILRLDDISCFVANWNDKPSNIKQIAQNLNIGADSLVFFDDNPAEREIVKKFLPEVEVIDVPEDPALFVKALVNSRSFEWNQLSKEDLSRSDSYVANEKRNKLATLNVDYDSFLKSLEMEGEIGRVGKMELPRFTQLISKSNQFNLRTRRYSEAHISDILSKPEQYGAYYVRLKDKFGDYGIISCVIVENKENIAFIDTWIMSCRILKRGVEDMVLNYLLEKAIDYGKEWLVGEYIPTKKNKLVKDLYPDLRFEPTSKYETTDQSSVYKLKLTSEIKKRQHYINYTIQNGKITNE